MRYLASLLAILVASSARADGEKDFLEASNRRGDEYVAVRDTLLKSPDIDSLIAKNERSEDWNKRLTATILRGWHENEDLYRKLLASDKSTDLQGNERFEWASDPYNIHARLMPLMLECLVKQSAGQAGTEAAIRVIPYLTRDEVPKSLDFLIPFIQSESTSPSNREAAARIVERLPNSLVSAQTIVTLLRHESSRTDANSDAAASLANALVSHAADLDVETRYDLVGILDDDDKIKKSLGEYAFIHTVGSVGSDRALPHLARYLEQGINAPESQWAVACIGRIGSKQAFVTLEELVEGDDPTLDIARATAIRGLGSAVYSQKSVQLLQATFVNQDDPELQIEAIRSLESLLNRTTDVASRRHVLETITKLSPSTDPDVQSEHRAILDRIK